jgi:putative intracellular protease/amidase
MTSIAMIMTGSNVWTMKDGTPHPTGFWAEEFVKPHRTFAGAGAEYVAESAWTPHAEVDGNLVTGQQNYSAQVTADTVLKVLNS